MADRHLICPMCETGGLSPITYDDRFQHHGADLFVTGLEGYECPFCGADPVFEDQIERNHRRILDAKRCADGLLADTEVRARPAASCANGRAIRFTPRSGEE